MHTHPGRTLCDSRIVTMAKAPDLTIHGLTKWFGSNEVLHDVSLEIRSGEFVGLMGPNGAGKSTLVKILDGIYTASSGEIRLGGQRVTSLGGRSEVGFIHQDLGLVEELSIVDNLRLGDRPLRLAGPILNRRAERAAAERALALVELDQPPDTLVADLAPGEKTLVAIARVLDRGAKIVFVDEATSTLPPTEARRVIAELARMAAEGSTVVMVTHKLSEILEACKRVVVLLDGRLATDETTTGLDRAALVGMLVQHEITRAEREAGEQEIAGQDGDVLLELRHACGGRAGPVDLQVRAGEVIGLTGLPGSGLHDVALLAHGSLRPTSGEVIVNKDVRRALVPPHRETQAVFAGLSVSRNMTVSSLVRWKTALRLLAVRREARDVCEMVSRLSVRPDRIDIDFNVLSGGNKQKVIFGRALFREPRLYLLCEPTRGVDVATRSEIYGLIREMRSQDGGVLIVSSDSEDLFAVCDRICVIEDGRVSQPRPAAELTMTELEAIV